MQPTLTELQYFQYLHDKVYHPEITAMSLQRRLSHLHQHLVKYGKTEFRLFDRGIDVLICVMSMANTVNIRLTDGFKLMDQEVYVFDDIKDQLSQDYLFTKYWIEVGQISKLLEGVDHLENIAVRNTLYQHLVSIVTMMVQLFRSRETCSLTLAKAIVIRLFEVKQKNIHYPFLHEQDSQIKVYKSMLMYAGV